MNSQVFYFPPVPFPLPQVGPQGHTLLRPHPARPPSPVLDFGSSLSKLFWCSRLAGRLHLGPA